MTKSKNTKRALILSVLSMFLCCAMLVGSTYAWFTDSVTAGTNTIAAGNLAVAVKTTSDLENWTEVKEDTNLFGDANTYWEPGHMEVAVLKIENVGDMAFQYKCKINATNKVKSINKAGQEIDLADHIKFAVFKITDDDATKNEFVKYLNGTGKRDDLLKVINDNNIGLNKLSETLSFGENLKGNAAGTSSKELPTDSGAIMIVVYMPTDVGNEANHAVGEAQPKIELGINVEAKQFTYEEDAFDNQYDAGAKFPDGTTGNGIVIGGITIKDWENGFEEGEGDLVVPGF